MDSMWTAQSLLKTKYCWTLTVSTRSMIASSNARSQLLMKRRWTLASSIWSREFTPVTQPSLGHSKNVRRIWELAAHEITNIWILLWLAWGKTSGNMRLLVLKQLKNSKGCTSKHRLRWMTKNTNQIQLPTKPLLRRRNSFWGCSCEQSNFEELWWWSLQKVQWLFKLMVIKSVCLLTRKLPSGKSRLRWM